MKKVLLWEGRARWDQRQDADAAGFVQAYLRSEGLILDATCRLTGVPMGLERKIRRAGHSVVVTLPSQLAELANMEEGDVVEFEYLGRGALRISKVG